jgi:HAD superfamily hydrolase (TIGR01509 family)
MTYQYIFFDFDGTVVNSIPAIICAVKETFSDFAFPEPDEAEIKRYIGVPLKTYFPYLAPEFYQRHDPEEIMKHYRRLYEEKYSATHVTLYDGMKGLLTELKNQQCKLGIVSSKYTEPIYMNMDQLEITEFFDAVIGCDQVRLYKPLPETVFACAQKLGIEDIRQAIVIGDSPKDIEMGQRAGCTTCAVPWGAGTPEELKTSKPDFYVESIKELHKILLT